MKPVLRVVLLAATLVVAGGLAGLLLATHSRSTAGRPTAPRQIGQPASLPAVSAAAAPAGGTLVGLREQLISGELRVPTYVHPLPGTGLLLVLERRGTVQRLDPRTGELSLFMDLTDRVDGTSGIEIGLLGFATHPEFANNRRFFVYYSDSEHQPVLAEFTAAADGLTGQANSERRLLRLSKYGLRHYGGMLQFGEHGLLYVSVGDGGEFYRNPQDPHTLLGSILRLNVDTGDPYAIPADNPFHGGAGAPEVWAYGLRNPWRYFLDLPRQLIYVADVGQEHVEEINIVPLQPLGYNFGWPYREGSACWELSPDCARTGLVEPALDYTHSEGCAITGGVVYRGLRIPELYGHYFYADWCQGWVRSLQWREGKVTNQRDWSTYLGRIEGISSFGLDADGELLLVTTSGRVSQLWPVRGGTPVPFHW